MGKLRELEKNSPHRKTVAPPYVAASQSAPFKKLVVKNASDPLG